MTSKAEESAVTLGVQLPDVFGLHAPKNVRSAITSRYASSLAEIVGEMGGHDEAVRAVVRRVLFRKGRLVDW